jgi:hypothetical protein
MSWSLQDGSSGGILGNSTFMFAPEIVFEIIPSATLHSSMAPAGPSMRTERGLAMLKTASEYPLLAGLYKLSQEKRDVGPDFIGCF